MCICCFVEVFLDSAEFASFESVQGGRSGKDFAGGLGFAGGGDSGGYGTFHRPVEQRREVNFK